MAPSNLVFFKILFDFCNVNSADLRILYSLELEYLNFKNIFLILIFSISSIVFPNIFDVCAPPTIRYGLNLLSSFSLVIKLFKIPKSDLAEEKYS